MIKGFSYNGTNINMSNCESCAMAKSNMTTYPKFSNNISNYVGQLIYSDVCGPINPTTKGGKRYFVIFLDDYSRFIKMYLLQNKNEVFQKFKIFKNFIEKHSGKDIKIFQSDNGTEYSNNEFKQLMEDQGIHQGSAEYILKSILG